MYILGKAFHVVFLKFCSKSDRENIVLKFYMPNLAAAMNFTPSVLNFFIFGSFFSVKISVRRTYSISVFLLPIAFEVSPQFLFTCIFTRFIKDRTRDFVRHKFLKGKISGEIM